jgi:hypothetical protein
MGLKIVGCQAGRQAGCQAKVPYVEQEMIDGIDLP